MLTMLLTTGLLLVTNPTTGTLSQAECNSLYSQAVTHNQNQQNLNQTAVAPYMPNSSNFSKIDSNSDSQVSRSEFLAGCQQGLIQPSSQSQ